MTILNLKNKQQNIEQALKNKKIKDALSILGDLCKDNRDGMLTEEHENIKFAYKSMLKYIVDGIKDPEQSNIYNNIILSCYKLSDKIFATIQNTQSHELFYETRRNYSHAKNESFSDVINEFYSEYTKNLMTEEANLNPQEDNASVVKLFNKVWISDYSNTTDANHIKKLINDTTIHYSYRCILITALTLGAIEEFNLWKILLLADCINHAENTLKQRAITGFLLILFKYDNRIQLYSEVTSRLKLIKDNESILKNIIATTIQLIRTRETEKLSNKLHDEIIPEVVKIHPNLRNKLDLENMISDNFLEGENPEWGDFFKEAPELMSKLEELTELQMEGSDVFLSTFKILKHFSFFSTLHNWFTPFYLDNSPIKEAIKTDKFIFSKTVQKSLADSGFLCNSDKYSLFLSIPYMPDFQKEMIGNMFKQQLEQMDEIESSEKLIDPEKMNSMISNRYIQDLYRFFKLHPQHVQFEDVFSWRMDFYNKNFFKNLISNTKQLRQIGEFFFKKEYFTEAAETFDLITNEEPNNVEITQKSAYCQQQIKNYSTALNLYTKADILRPEQIWTTKKIALMYKYLKQPVKALEYYQIAERLKPEDLHTQALIGHCHLDLKNYNEALKYYFKVEYLDHSNTKVWRPIGWCSFVTGNLNQAEKYYKKILSSNSNEHDLINIGHVLLCKNNKSEALKYYQKAILLLKNDFKKFEETFNEDLEYIIANNINTDDIPMLLDQLKYIIES